MTFDELFNEFLKNNNLNSEDSVHDAFREQIMNVFDMLMNMKNLDNIDGELDGYLGKPDKIEGYDEGDMHFEKMTWHTPTGDIVKVVVTTDPTLPSKNISQKSLQEKLQEAIDAEDYETAAAIRDEIKKRKNLKDKTDNTDSETDTKEKKK